MPLSSALSSFVGGILGLLILGVINAQIAAIALILPGTLFLTSSAAQRRYAGNAEGGIKGCIAGSFVHGLLIALLACTVHAGLYSHGLHLRYLLRCRLLHHGS